MDTDKLEIISNSSLMTSYHSNATGHISNNPFTLPIWFVLPAIVCSFGILANSFIIFVIMFSTLRTSTFMNLLMSLAIFDIVVLFITITTKMQSFFEIFPDKFLLYCRLMFYILNVAGIVSSWISVLISLERYIAIYYPFKVHIYCTKKNTYITILSLTISTSIGLIPIFYTHSVKILEPNQTCLPTVADAASMVNWCITFILYCPLPFFFMIFLNIKIIRKFKAQILFRLRSQGESCKQTSSANNPSLVAMMITVSLVFAVTSFPATILLTVQHSCTLMQASLCLPKWLIEVSFMLNNINHSVNFFLYCLSGSVFRLALINMFRCKKRTSSRSFVTPHISVAENVM